VNLTIIVRVDNVRAIFIGSVLQRSKHIDVRYPFVREFVQDGFLDCFRKNEGEQCRYFYKELIRGITRYTCKKIGRGERRKTERRRLGGHVVTGRVSRYHVNHDCGVASDSLVK